MKVIKIIKINVIALLALPLFLFATIVRLMSKALQKTVAIAGTILIACVIALLFEAARDIGGAFEIVILVFVVIVIGGIFTALIIWLLSLVSALIMVAVGGAIFMLEYVYAGVYSCYAALFQICNRDYEELEGMDNPALKGASCFLFSLLEAVNKGVIFFVSHAIKILAAASVVIVVGGIVLFDLRIHRTFGVHLFDYMKLFPVFEIIYGIVLYFVFTFGLSSILISLGLEWNKWGAEMRASTSDYGKYAESISGRWQRVDIEQKETDESGRDVKRCMEACESLNRHMEEFEDFVQEVSSLIDESGDFVLRTYLGDYLELLQEISGAFASFEGTVPLKEFEKYTGKIKEADAVKKNLTRRAGKVRMHQEKAVETAKGDFFSGCDTAEKLEKRYRALCKTYHPDNETGDGETFKRIMGEYENRKKELS